MAYASLKGELKVGRYYVRFLLDPAMSMEALQGPQKLLGQLYHRFLTEAEPPVQVMCLRAMARVYEHYNNQPFDRYALASLIRLLHEPSIASPTFPPPSSPWSLAGAGVATHPSAPAGGLARGLQESVTVALLGFIAVATRNDSNAQTLLLSCDLVPLLVRLAARANEDLAALPELRHPAAVSPGPGPGALAGIEGPEGCIGILDQSIVETDARPAGAPRDADGEQRGPAETSAALALRLLETMISKKRSVSDAGARLRPLPLAIRLVTSQELLPHLLPLLLSPDPGIKSVALRVIESSLRDAPPRVLASLLALGPVPLVLFALLKAPRDSEEAAGLTRLLRHFHVSANADAATRLEKCRSKGRGYVAEDWLPDGLCLILARDEAWLGRLAEALYWGFDEVECRPWVVWSDAMRRRLYVCLLALLRPYLQRLPLNPLAPLGFPETVEVPNYFEAAEACWLNLNDDGTAAADDDSDLNGGQASGSLAMGYYLDSLARHAASGRALAIAAGDADRLSSRIAERLSEEKALDSRLLADTIKMLQVYAALVLQHTVRPHALEPLVRRILISCRDDPAPPRAPAPAALDAGVPPSPRGERGAGGQEAGDEAAGVGVAQTATWSSRLVTLSEALRWGLCAIATGGSFGGDVTAEISLIRSVLTWNSKCDRLCRPSRALSAACVRTLGQIRAWALRCAATLFVSAPHKRQALEVFATADEDETSLVMIEQIGKAFLDKNSDEISAACSCISSCCSSILGLTHLDGSYESRLGLSLIKSYIPVLILESLLECGDVAATQAPRCPLLSVCAHPQSAHPAEPAGGSRDEAPRPAASDHDVGPAGLFPIFESCSPLAPEVLYKDALKKAEALAAIARHACLGREAAADGAGLPLRALLTAPLYQRLLESDAAGWLRLLFGEHFSADLVWGEENRACLVTVLSELLREREWCIYEGSASAALLHDRLRGFGYRNLRSLTPVAGVYLELLPHQADRAAVPVPGSDSELEVPAGDEVEDMRLLPRGWPVVDLDVFIGNVMDLLAHGLDDSAPTPAQARAALDVLLHLARHFRLLRAKYRHSAAAEALAVDVITSPLRAEVLVSLLQLPRDGAVPQELSLKALRVLATATDSAAAAALCAGCKCQRVPALAGCPGAGRAAPLAKVVSRSVLQRLVIRAGSVAVDDPDRLLLLLVFALNLGRASQGAKLLDELAQQCVVEACVLAVLVCGCDASMTSRGAPPYGAAWGPTQITPQVTADAAQSEGRDGAGEQERREGLDLRVLRVCCAAGALVESMVSGAASGRTGARGADSDRRDGRDGGWGASEAGEAAHGAAAAVAGHSGEREPGLEGGGGRSAQAARDCSSFPGGQQAPPAAARPVPAAAADAPRAARDPAAGASPPRPGAYAGGAQPASKYDGGAEGAGSGAVEAAWRRPGSERLRACLPEWMAAEVLAGRQRLADCLLQNREPVAAADSQAARPGWNHVGRRALWWHLVDLVGVAQRAAADE